MGVEEAEGGAVSEDEEDRAKEREAGRDAEDGFGLSMPVLSGQLRQY